jgi:hypothetical protein
MVDSFLNFDVCSFKPPHSPVLNLAAVESFITYVYVVDLLNGDIRRSIGVWSQITNSITAAILEESWMWIVCGLEVPGHKE